MQTSEERFGKIIKIGGRTHWSQDFYHYLLVIGWLKFFFLFVSFFLSFNLFFGALYWAFPQALSGTTGSFFESFLFSVQTYTTVGYGTYAPSTLIAHVIVVIESIMMIFSSAAMMGLVFAKFSRPHAKIIFSKNALISMFNGKNALMMRLGNLRANQINDAQIRLVALENFTTPEGETVRRQVDLKLQRSSTLFFALSWLVVHYIDEQSPLYKLNSEEITKRNIEIAVSVVGNDSTFSQTVNASCIYMPPDILFNRYFEDVIESTNGQIKAINYRKFHNLKPT